jgi:Flp pilus assembly protein TadG
MWTRSRGSKESARGSTLIEFALVLPLFLILLFATVEFGRYFYVEHTLQFATREGVRLGLVGRTVNDADGHALDRAASITRIIREKARIAVNPSDVSVNIYPVNADYSDPIGWQGMQDPGSAGTFMRVRTRYTLRLVLPLFGPSVPMEAQATYRNELF